MKQKNIEKTPKEHLEEDLCTAMDEIVLDLMNSTIAEDSLRLRGNLSALSEAYKAFEENSNKEKEVRETSKAANKTMITGFGTTILNVATTVGLTLATFGFETSGQGSFFTTAGRAAISAALKGIKK